MALSDLKSAFLKPEDWLLANANHKGDQVKWTRTVGNYARALDLYLALENAYDFYGGSDRVEYNDENSTVLLSKTQKKQIMSRLFERMETINGYLYSDSVDPFSGVQNYEVEPGNRPMKMFLAIGYAALGMQNFLFYDDFANASYYTNTPTNTMLQDAFRSGGLQETQNSIKYWSYQTRNGKRFWAEGPYYFEFSLLEVIPFWHSIRLNNMLNWNGNNISDPFANSWFLDPLNWLADLTTPDGKLPPIDDGNKRIIRYSNMLRWNNTYSNSPLGEVVGKKYAWIHDKITPGNSFSDVHTLLVEIAIPKNYTPQAPRSFVGNENSGQVGNSAEQQVVIRSNDASGKTHYVYINGESGDAITRGEGHEQADQLQILYYYDGKSYLMDTGYDRGAPTTNSSWNRYDLHNLMSFYNAQDGGLPSPTFTLKRKTSEHAAVDQLYKSEIGNVVAVQGAIPIKHFNYNGRLLFTTTVSRKVLFIKQDNANNISPYVIDINTNDGRPSNITTSEKLRHEVYMRYFSDTQNYTHSIYGWSKFDHGTNDLYLYTDYLESKMEGRFTVYKTDYLAREEQGRDIGTNQEGYPVTYRELRSANLDAGSYNILAILSIDDSSPSSNPQKIFSYADDNYTRPHQGWYWRQDATTVDVIVKRSKIDMTKYNQNLDFTIDEGGIFISDIRLPAGKDYGFARLSKSGGYWQIDPDYQINLTQVYPITASISGPTSLSVGQQGTWTVEASSPPGAPGTFSYEWYLKSDDPQASGYYGPLSYSDTYSTQMYDFDNYLSLKVQIKRDSEVSLARYHVFCNDLQHRRGRRYAVAADFLGGRSHPAGQTPPGQYEE